MNANRIVQMVIHILVAKVVHFGVNAGIDAVSRRKSSSRADDDMRPVAPPPGQPDMVLDYDDPAGREQQEQDERAARRQRRQQRRARRAAREARQAE